MANFGKTYWERAWFNALNNIGHSNCLPRRRSYASRGAVLDIKQSGTQINAKVSGRRLNPYSITIDVPEFNVPEKDNITDILVVAHPSFLASLLNRELPGMINKKSSHPDIGLEFDSRIICNQLRPLVETQAADRVYRIGQDKNVMVYRMITEGTLEEKIDAMFRPKKAPTGPLPPVKPGGETFSTGTCRIWCSLHPAWKSELLLETRRPLCVFDYIRR